MNGPEDRVSIPSRVIPKTQKWYLIPPCLTPSFIRYISRVKSSNPLKGVAPSLIPRCCSNWKGSHRVALDYGRQLYFTLIYIYIYIYIYREREMLGYVKSSHFKLMISRIHFIYFRCGLLCIKQESVWHCLWEKQYHDAIHSTRNLETSSWMVGIQRGFFLEGGSIYGQIHVDENQNTHSTSWCLGWSLVKVTLRLHFSSHMKSGWTNKI